jgi:hypothetical protein
MDSLPIIIAYQKILDAWIEEKLVAPWRSSLPQRGYLQGTPPSLPYKGKNRDSASQ